MMVAMMLPSLTPMLSRYRQAMSQHECSARLSADCACGRWATSSSGRCPERLAFPLGAVLDGRSRFNNRRLRATSPIAIATIVLDRRRVLQLTAWKAPSARLLSRNQARSCTRSPARARAAAWRRAASRTSLQLQLRAALTAIALVTGVMDLRVMAAVTAAITAERLAPAGERAASSHRRRRHDSRLYS